MNGRDFDELLADLDGPRPVPATLRSRLEASLRAAAGDDELVAQLARQDGPRPLPADLRSRLEASLLANRSVPRRLRRRVEQTLVVVRSPSPRARLGAAAAVLLIVGLTLVAVSGRGSGRDDDDDALPGGPRERRASPDGGASGAADGSGLSTGADSGVGGQAAADGSAGGGAAATANESAGASGGGASVGGAAAPPLRLGVVRGNKAVEAGFDAYMELLNRNGGVGGRAVEVVATSEAAPATDTLATVNLSGTPLTASWAQVPLLEAADATEATLVNEVFSFTSVLERQAHLAVVAAFPEPTPGATAAIYHGRSGPYATRVPAAFEEALRAQGVASVRILVDAGSPTLVPADAAFASLDGAGLRALLAAAREDGYTPARGLWGIGSLFDEDLLASLPKATRVLSPYAPPAASEATALRERSGRPLSAATVHGWVTAKMLVVALQRGDVGSPAELTQALDGLTGYENGFMPPYEVRKGTRSRMPEGLVLVPERDGFRPATAFMRDRF